MSNERYWRCLAGAIAVPAGLDAPPPTVETPGAVAVPNGSVWFGCCGFCRGLLVRSWAGAGCCALGDSGNWFWSCGGTGSSGPCAGLTVRPGLLAVARSGVRGRSGRLLRFRSQGGQGKRRRKNCRKTVLDRNFHLEPSKLSYLVVSLNTARAGQQQLWLLRDLDAVGRLLDQLFLDQFHIGILSYMKLRARFFA